RRRRRRSETPSRAAGYVSGCVLFEIDKDTCRSLETGDLVITRDADPLPLELSRIKDHPAADILVIAERETDRDNHLGFSGGRMCQDFRKYAARARDAFQDGARCRVAHIPRPEIEKIP